MTVVTSTTASWLYQGEGASGGARCHRACSQSGFLGSWGSDIGASLRSPAGGDVGLADRALQLAATQSILRSALKGTPTRIDVPSSIVISPASNAAPS